MDRFTYTGERTNEISFPLGGLGTGCIGLAGNGRLIDWEIAGRPNKGSLNGFSHFAIKAESGGEVIDARVLHGDLPPPYTGSLNAEAYASFGFGPHRGNLAGLPHFPDVVFRGEFPMATLEFRRRGFPAQVEVTAFNPFIPLNDKDSGIPAAFFDLHVKNTTKKPVSYTLAATLSNPLPEHNIHTLHEGEKQHYLHLTTDSLSEDSVEYGDLCLATDAGSVSFQQFWYRGAFFDSLEVYWRDFTTPGKFTNRVYPEKHTGKGNHGLLAAHFRLQPGKTRSIRYVISWNYPNAVNYWSESARRHAESYHMSLTWKNYYATFWESSMESARYALENWDRLFQETLRFKNALFASDLPAAALEAITANIAALKTPTVMRLQDGTFYGFEGCHPSSGCCEGSCTHVWNYAQALPFLFPKLERSMREADYRYNQQPDGGMPFRLQLPLGLQHPGGRSCADGLFGNVMKVYRDWKICGDMQWLESIWPSMYRSVEYAWAQSNEDKWDPRKTGVLWGRQHHTLDAELFGPNPWLTGFYLGALKAISEMALFLGKPAISEDCRRLFETGKAWVDENLFNGEYYQQVIDLKEKSITDDFDASGYYWSEEHGEIKYQIGEGCEIDQVLAQWHANLYGLGEIFDPKKVRKALRSVFKYNCKKPMGEHYNPCRVYCLNDEAGLVIASWPEGKAKPVIPVPYSQEAMNGFEYAAAVQLIQSGLVKEGMTVVEAVRDRYDGKKRNPWNEFECGSNYARSMASYALLNAFSGFEFDMVEGMLGFHPLQTKDGRFQCFWSLAPAWGVFRCQKTSAELSVLEGSLVLTRLRLSLLKERKARAATVKKRSVPFEPGDGQVSFPGSIRINRDESLKISVR